MEERMISLQLILDRKAVIPTTLITAHDISVALYLTVYDPDRNWIFLRTDPNLNWSFAEKILKRFFFLWSEDLLTFQNETDHIGSIKCSNFGKTVWGSNYFDGNMVKLLNGGDCWRVRKTLELISDNFKGMTSNLIVSVAIFDSLASTLLEPLHLGDGSNYWIYLIAKNQDRVVDCDISRLINSFLYSREGKTSIARNILKIIYSFCEEKYRRQTSTLRLSHSRKIPEALVKVLIEEKRNEDVIDLCLNIVHTLVMPMFNHQELAFCLVEHGICEALITVIDIYSFNEEIVNKVLRITQFIVKKNHRKTLFGDDWNQTWVNLERFISAGLLEGIVQAYNSPINCPELKYLVTNMYEYDGALKLAFYGLGIPEGSDVFSL